MLSDFSNRRPICSTISSIGGASFLVTREDPGTGTAPPSGSSNSSFRSSVLLSEDAVILSTHPRRHLPILNRQTRKARAIFLIQREIEAFNLVQQPGFLGFTSFVFPWTKALSSVTIIGSLFRLLSVNGFSSIISSSLADDSVLRARTAAPLEVFTSSEISFSKLISGKKVVILGYIMFDIRSVTFRILNMPMVASWVVTILSSIKLNMS
mmetsp:Transcript_38760/g.44085  ORF Transcript_38760/g.44085 Transcript_38760/m.44085 type:complete len:210 (-) Transcript_38760:2092-2721(-)